MTQAIVIGAGMTGLASAWHLQSYGYDVTILDRVGVAGGSSWGNAGWLAPGKTIPLAHPSLWTYGPTALFDPNAALSVPPRIDPKLWAFCAKFMAHATQRSWDRTMAALTPADREALAAFDELVEGGVDSALHDGEFVVGFEKESQAADFLGELEGALRHGQHFEYARVRDRATVEELAPVLSGKVEVVYTIGGQRYIEPGPFCEALAASITERGGTIRETTEVTDVLSTRKPTVKLSTGEWLNADVVVIATGAWLPDLAKRLGVRTMVQAGRGYSFSVETDFELTHAIYLPHTRVACTPYQGRLRVAGTMEFRGPDESFQPARIDSIVAATKPQFRGVDWGSRQDEWVGSRPVTPDGLPLVGPTKAPNVFVCGGHGMWGMVLGPVSGKMLAKRIATGETDPVIASFDPLR